MWRLVFVLGLLVSSGVFAAERSARMQVGVTITGPSKSVAIRPQAATGTIPPRQPIDQGSAVDPAGNISSPQSLATPTIVATDP